MMAKVVLSRRNLLTLLAKLDRVQKGEQSSCMIVKGDNRHPKELYRQSHSQIVVMAVEDEDYYTDRMPGPTIEDV